MRLFRSLAFVVLSVASAACNTSGAKPEPKQAPPATAATPAAQPAAANANAEGALRLGAPIEASVQKVSLSEVAKNPGAFVGKTFATTGTVTAVCQHMGCWMEIKDEAGEAHIKMSGHAFFVPKSASGRKARVMATLVKSDPEAACEGAGHDEGKMSTQGGAAPAGKGKGCRAEAEAQLGRPLAKLELVAQGVELQ